MYQVRDDLHDFAEHALHTLPLGGMNAGLGLGAHYGPVHAAVVHRQGPYQIELVTFRPGYEIPVHTHLGTDSIEFPLFGGVRFELAGHRPFDHLDDARFLQFSAGKALRIGNDVPHAGRALDGIGAMFLSFQRWTTPMTPLGDNYQGAEMAPGHRERIVR